MRLVVSSSAVTVGRLVLGCDDLVVGWVGGSAVPPHCGFSPAR
jgi:hypothetical protein